MFLFIPPEEFDPEKHFKEVPLQQGLLYKRWKIACGHRVVRFAVSGIDDTVQVFVQCIGYRLPFIGVIWIAAHGPIGTFPDVATEIAFYRELQKLCKKEASSTFCIRLGAHPPSSLLQHPSERGASALNQPPSEYRISLEASFDTVVETFSKSMKRYIRLYKEKESGIRFQVERTDFSAHLESIYTLLTETAESKGFSVHPKEYYQTILAELTSNPEYGTLVLGYIEKKKTPVSFVLTVYTGSEAYHLFSGNAMEGYEEGMPTLTLYTTMKEAKRQNIVWFNLGAYYIGTEMALQSLVNQSLFKRKFNGEVLAHSPQHDLVAHRVRYLVFRIVRLYPVVVVRRFITRWYYRLAREFSEEHRSV